MQPKTFIWIAVAIGSTVGAYVPSLWGAGIFSFSSLVTSTLGAVAGVWLGIKLAQRYL